MKEWKGDCMNKSCNIQSNQQETKDDFTNA